MRRFVTFAFLLLLALPAGINITGCYRNPAANYCNGLGYGPKITQVSTITLTPKNTGISLAFGQTRQSDAPSAYNCKLGVVSVSAYTYGTTNNQLVDISPQGNICAGTWNRNSGGGIPDYTICNPPNPVPSTNGLPFGSAFITATAQSVTSNPVQVFVHAPVTSVALVAPTQCLSQGEQATLDAEACYAGPNNAQYEFCAPSSVTSYSCKSGLAPRVSSVPSCSASIGTLTYTAGTPSIAAINPQTNQITAQQPGTTVITANIAGSGSSAGYFSTCPPASISITYGGSTSGTVTQGVVQNMATNVIDTKGHTITGLALDYQSTNPVDVSVGTGGNITPNFAGSASVYAVCQPPNCNQAPINQIGFNGTGLPIASNAVNLSVPGTATSYVWFGAPGQSQYVVPLQLLTGSLGSNIRLPYVPNSMVMDRFGQNIYFGSDNELMTLNTNSDTLGTPNLNVPGVVLAVSPTGSQVLINDRKRQLFYLYPTGTTSGSTITFAGMGTSAEWTPDGNTLYISDTAAAGPGHANTLYVYNTSTGFSTYPLPTSGGPSGPENVAVTVPGVGAYISGDPTVAHTWCPTGTPGNNSTMSFYPQGDSVNTNTETLAATSDGMHILGAAAVGSSSTPGPISFADIGVTIPSTPCPAPVNGVLQPLTLNHNLNQTTLNVSATAVNEVITTPAAVKQGAGAAQFSLSFVTYSGNASGATLPYYKQTSSATSSLGTVGYVPLTAPSSGAAPTAPIAGAFSPDGTQFFVSTSGDNQIHFIDTNSLTDTQQIAPKLPACTPGTDAGCTLPAPVSGPVPATVVVAKPHATT